MDNKPAPAREPQRNLWLGARNAVCLHFEYPVKPNWLSRVRKEWLAFARTLAYGYPLRFPRGQADAAYDMFARCPGFGQTLGMPEPARHARRFCRCAAICPFCYGRQYVFAALVRLKDYIMAQAPQREKLRLYSFVCSKDFLGEPGVRWSFGNLDDLEGLVRQARDWMAKHRLDEVHAWGAEAAAVLHRFIVDEKRNRVLVLRGGLVLTRRPVEQFKACPYGTHEQRERRGGGVAGHFNLIKQAPHAFAYPACNLEETPGVIACMLNTLKNVRMLSIVGCTGVPKNEWKEDRSPRPQSAVGAQRKPQGLARSFVRRAPAPRSTKY